MRHLCLNLCKGQRIHDHTIDKTHHVASANHPDELEVLELLLISLDQHSAAFGLYPRQSRRGVEAGSTVPLHLADPFVVSLVVADPVVHLLGKVGGRQRL